MTGVAARVLNESLVSRLGLGQSELNRITEREREKLQRQERTFREGREPPAFEGKTVILVDDGLATGVSMRAAVVALRHYNPRSVVVAVPTAPPDACDSLGEVADRVVAIITPTAFSGVGAWYQDFAQVSDQQARRLLSEAQR